MRFWHKDLISVLPKKQLVSQWRECSAIFSNIIKSGFPRSPLVIKMMQFPLEETVIYNQMIFNELTKRNYKVNKLFLAKAENLPKQLFPKQDTNKNIYKFWHNKRYLKQCYYNLQEKFDCGVITQEEWQKIEDKYKKRI